MTNQGFATQSDRFAEDEPLIRDARFRIEMTVGCRDCEELPKVSHAGEVVTENGQSVQIMHNGLRVVAGGYHGDWMEEVIERLNGHHEPQEEVIFNAILGLLPSRATMIELGCFWSYYSLWFLKGHSDRRALGVEPDPQNLSIGRRNAALNGLSIELRQGFIGPEERNAENFTTETSGDQIIPMIRPSSLCRTWAPDGLDVLHCDTQGAETIVIQDCEDLLRKGLICYLIVSTHAEAISGDALTHQRCLEMIRRFGGRVLAEHDVHESFSGDGLIAAYFGKESIAWPDLEISYNRYSTSLFRNPLYDLRLCRLTVDHRNFS